MINFFTELEHFIQNCQNIDTNGVFFEYRGAKIPFDVATEIWQRWAEAEACMDMYNEKIEEQCDYIRLLREENKRLRGSNENAE